MCIKNKSPACQGASNKPTQCQISTKNKKETKAVFSCCAALVV